MTQTGTRAPGLSGPGSNGNEGLLHILQISRTVATPRCSLVSYPGHPYLMLMVEMLSLCTGYSQRILSPVMRGSDMLVFRI